MHVPDKGTRKEPRAFSRVPSNYTRKTWTRAGTHMLARTRPGIHAGLCWWAHQCRTASVSRCHGTALIETFPSPSHLASNTPTWCSYPHSTTRLHSLTPDMPTFTTASCRRNRVGAWHVRLLVCNCVKRCCAGSSKRWSLQNQILDLCAAEHSPSLCESCLDKPAHLCAGSPARDDCPRC